MTGTPTESLRSWAGDLAAWRIPEPIMSRATESPWVLPEEVFSRRAARQLAAPGGPSYHRALEALGAGGTVLDVGAGAGAGCLPLASRATRLIAVDSHRPLLDDLVVRAAPLGVPVSAVQGCWPDISAQVPVADVVLCHHVLYNVPDLGPFVAALTGHARRLVVVEVTDQHPLAALNPYWLDFHGIKRPQRPTAEQLVEVLRALGLSVSAERWQRPPAAEYRHFDSLVEVTRRRLCLPPDRAPEVAAALRRRQVDEHQPPDLGSSGDEVVTITWPGTA